MVTDRLIRIPGAADTLVVHFTRPIKDTIALAVTGVRPNDETAVDTIKALVINPYFIKPNAFGVIMDKTIVVSVARADTKQPAQGLLVSWKVNGADSTIAKPLGPYSFIPAQQRTQNITAKLQDSIGNGFYLAAIAVTVGGYQQTLDSATFKSNPKLGDPLTLIIVQSDSDATPYKLFVIGGNWRDSSELRPFKARDTIRLNRAIADINPIADTVFTIDSSGLISDTVVIKAQVTYALPSVLFVSDSLIVSLKDSTRPITLDPKSTGAKFIWVLDTLKPDTTDFPSYIKPLQDTFPHVLTVKGMDQFGYVGLSASIKIRAQRFRYAIEPIVFPMYPKVNTWTTWIAAVNDTALARQNNARFHWTISQTNYDSILITGADSSILKLRWSSAVSNTISVSAMDDSNNTSPSYLQNIFVRRFGPSIKITTTKPLNAKTTDLIRITASAIDSNIDGTVTNSTIKRIIWQRDDNSVKDSTADTAWQIASISPDTFEVYAWAQDTDGFLSQPDSIQIMVRAYRPYIQPLMANSTVYIKSSVGFKVSGHVSDPTAVMAKYLWDFDGNGAWDDSSATDSITHSFSNPGKTMVIVKCRDNNNMESIPDTFFVTVSTGAPQRPAMKPDTVWIVDNTVYTITSKAMNPNAVLKQWVVRWDTGGLWETDTAAAIRHAYLSAGLKQVTYYVKDNNGISSDTVKDTVMVLPGAPWVASITIDSALSKIFINTTLHFTVHGFDPNGQIDSIKVSWTGSASAFTQTLPASSNAATFAHAFIASGPDTLRFRVIDNDGLPADTVFPIFVRKGKPVITSITPDSVIFINDARRFFISTYDTNGTVDSIKIDNGSGAFGLFVKTTGNLDTLKRTFGLLQAGTRTIRVIAKDNDGLLSDTARDTVTVRLGTPVVDSMQVPATIWINDTNTYQIVAHDTNGTIVKYYFDWTNSGTWQDSSTTGSAQGHFNAAGADSVRFGVMDNDTLLTISKKKIMVHLGVPRVWNPGGDTMFVVTPTVGNYNLHISAFDTNGTFSQFYWSAASPYDTTSAIKTDSVMSQYISTNDINLGYKMAVFGKDDDGNMAGDTFWLYPDAPPPAPTINAVAGTDSVTIYWLGKDVKDGNMTQYRVLLHNNSEPDSTMAADILSNWKSGYRLSNLLQFDFMLKVKVAHSVNLYYYQVQARDARGSVTSSTTGHTFSY
jgi:hypothetical protein